MRLRMYVPALVLYALVSFPVSLHWIITPGIEGYGRAGNLNMVYRTAYRPYVLRALSPFVVRQLSKVLYRDFDAAKAQARFEFLMDGMKKFAPDGHRSLKRWNEDYLHVYLATWLVAYFALIGFAFGLRLLLLELYAVKPAVASAVPAFAVAFLPMFFRYCNYIYDFPQLFIFTLGMLALARKNMPFFYSVYVVGLLNKETTLLLMFLFWILTQRKILETRNRRAHLIAMGAIFVCVRLSLTAVFRKNPGFNFEFHLLDHNIAFLMTQPFEYFRLVAVGMIALAVFYKWNEKPAFTRVSLWMAIPLFALAVFLGFLDEFRDYYELFPTLILLATHSVCRFLDIPLTPRIAPAPTLPAAQPAPA